MYDPPPGYADFLDDVEGSDIEPGPYRHLEVEGIGSFRCRRPMPNSCAALGAAAGAKITDHERTKYVGLFVQNHMHPDDFDDLLLSMMCGGLRDDAIGEVCRAIATWGTARPTGRSSTSRC